MPEKWAFRARKVLATASGKCKGDFDDCEVFCEKTRPPPDSARETFPTQRFSGCGCKVVIALREQ